MSDESILEKPLRLGDTTLAHRIVMGPMTRLRADDAHTPLPMVKEYYEQRSSMPGGLLITEATHTSPRSLGRDVNAPGIFTPDQIRAWRSVTDAVHARGCTIFMQLWHVGRAAREAALREAGLEMLSSSAVPIDESSMTPRAMSEAEIWETINDFATAADNAVHKAGFDGIELHAANGYLIDQFIQDVSNHRTDSWGGSIEKRSRFCVEVVSAVTNKVGTSKVGVRLSPYSRFQGMGMEDPLPQFHDLLERLKLLKLAYLHLIEPRVDGNVDREGIGDDSLGTFVRSWGRTSPILLAGGYDAETAKSAIRDYAAHADVAIVFGRQFIANPDLPYRFVHGLELNKYDRATFYKVKSPDGYIDYPAITVQA